MKILEAIPYLRVSNMDRSLRFYRDGLAFEVFNKIEEGGSIVWVRLVKDSMSIMLSLAGARMLDGHEYEHAHDEHGRHIYTSPNTVVDGELNFVTYIYVEDADAAFEEVKSRGITPEDAPGSKVYGLREFLVRDPDGYYYAIGHRLEPQ